ncbi:hypothetical protein M1563_04925 [Patescibacteria group bacterium]|nr:hypothetical protein [Patescibacteria group bacterium]MCL5409455.1 hypothetical protein [Patescibacteria group bacterium]
MNTPEEDSRLNPQPDSEQTMKLRNQALTHRIQSQFLRFLQAAQQGDVDTIREISEMFSGVKMSKDEIEALAYVRAGLRKQLGDEINLIHKIIPGRGVHLFRALQPKIARAILPVASSDLVFPIFGISSFDNNHPYQTISTLYGSHTNVVVGPDHNLYSLDRYYLFNPQGQALIQDSLTIISLQATVGQPFTLQDNASAWELDLDKLTRVDQGFLAASPLVGSLNSADYRQVEKVLTEIETDSYALN